MSTDRGHTRGRRALALVARLAVVAALAGMAACGGDDEPSTSPTTSSETTTTPSTTAPLSPEEEAKAVYLEFVDVVERLVTHDPNPDDPALAELAIDPVLSTMRDSVTTLRSENQVWQQGDRNSHQVFEQQMDGDSRVVLQDCLVENDVLIDRDSGAVVETQPLATRTLEVGMARQGNSWVVATIDIVDEVAGEVPCAG